MNMVIEKRWLSTAEMCARYGVSRETINQWERSGVIPRADRGAKTAPRRPRWWAPLVDDWDKQKAGVDKQRTPKFEAVS